MSKCFRKGEGKPPTRGTSPGTATAGAVKKKISSQSVPTPTAKRKYRSVGSAASCPRSATSDDHMNEPQEKALPSAVVNSQPSQQDAKETTSTQSAATDSELQYKRREFLIFRKQFIQQQNAYIDRYAQLRDMEAQSGTSTGNAGEVRLLSVTDWPVHDLLLMSESAPGQQTIQIKGVLGPKILQQLTTQLTGIREQVLAMGTELMRRRLEILKFIRALQRNDNRVFVYEGNSIEWESKNAEFDKETVKLRELVLATVNDLEVKLTHSLDAAKIPWIDRDNMIKKIDRLQKELANLKKSKLDEPVKTEKTADHKKLLEDLQRERAARANLKEMLASAEERAEKVRARCAELEKQLNARSKWGQNSKQTPSRVSNHEGILKKSEKELKKNEVTVEVLSRLRDTLQIRVSEQEDQAREMMQEAEERETKLTARVESLLSKLEEEEKQKKMLETQAQEMEQRFEELEEKYNKLHEQSRELVEAHNWKCLEYLPRKVQCSCEDFGILCDLQATKDALGRVKAELDRTQADKDDLVKSLAEIAKEQPENRIAEKLLIKENTITDMRQQLKEMTENNNTMEQNLKSYENQISALRLEVSLLRNLNDYKSCENEIPHEELEKQVFELCLRVERLTRERDAMASEAATRALMLERHERCAELFAQITRARRDLAAHLDGTDKQSLNGAGNREVSSVMSKTYLSSANTWSALRAERARVLRLEGIVAAQTQQLDRESAVRIKMDRRCAQLERQLLRTWASSGEIPPAVSFEISAPGPGEVDTSPNSGTLTPLPSANNGRPTHAADFKNSSDKLYPSLNSNTTRRIKSDKRCASLTTSRNSSLNSLLQLGFDDADTFQIIDQDPAESSPVRGRKASDTRLIAKKRQEIIQIQKLLMHQQKLYIGLYAQLKDLEARSGVHAGDCLGEIRMLTMKGWPPHDLLLLVMEPPGKPAGNVLETTVLKQLTSELSSIPKDVLNMGADLTARRTKLLEYARKRIPESKIGEFDSETGMLHKIVFETAKHLESKINRCLEIAKTSWKDRDMLLKKIERLNKELCVFRGKIKSLEEKEDEKPSDDQNKKIDSRSATELREKLTKERAARESMKHTVATAEGMLRTARARITVLERELKQAQKQVELSTRKHKEYESLHRCRETSYDVRSKRLLQESKTGEVTIEMLSLQRDALEIRVQELQEQIKTTIKDNEGRELKLQASLERLQEKTHEQERLNKLAESRETELEKRLKVTQDQYTQLLDKSEKLVKMNSEKCLDYLPHKESEPTQREAELWKKLQLTKTALARAKDELQQSREDKDSLLNSLAKIAQEGSENNMANELILREQKNFQLQQVIEELKQNVQSMKETLAQKETLIISLKLQATKSNYECCSKDSPKQELALEVIELTAQVAKLTREREALITEATTRTLMLERYERCAELFARVTRARRDVVAQLNPESRAERPRSEGAFHDANLSSSVSSSCLKAAKTWEELRTDRERVQQLQDVVASQNLQLQRECRIRNQLEQRRAILERLFLNRASPDQYIPAENVSAYFGTSSYFVNDAFTS